MFNKIQKWLIRRPTHFDQRMERLDLGIVQFALFSRLNIEKTATFLTSSAYNNVMLC